MENLTQSQLIRKEAIERYFDKKEEPKTIYKSLGRTKGWFSKLITKCRKHQRKKVIQGFSKAPHKVWNKIDEEIITKVVEIRKKLRKNEGENRYQYKGAIAVQIALEDENYQGHIPSISTIKKIIRERDKITQPKKGKRKKSGRYYPLLRPTLKNEVHQLDLVGPRYIKNDGLVYMVNIVDVVSFQAGMEIERNKSASALEKTLIGHWTKEAIPRYLQMDNEAAARGGMYHERSMGRIIRLCLYLDVEVVFIAESSPWMNGTIESFNNRTGEVFWEQEEFKNRQHMLEERVIWIDNHNRYQERTRGKLKSIPLRRLPNVSNIPKKLPISEGKIHFIRYVKENKEGHGIVKVLNEEIKIPEGYIKEYVWITIDTKQEELKAYYQQKEYQSRRLIKQIKYKLREPVVKGLT